MKVEEKLDILYQFEVSEHVLIAETYEDLTATIKFWMCKIDEVSQRIYCMKDQSSGFGDALQWPNKLESFQKIIASLANAYCEPQPTVCCISRWGNHR